MKCDAEVYLKSLSGIFWGYPVSEDKTELSRHAHDARHHLV